MIPTPSPRAAGASRGASGCVRQPLEIGAVVAERSVHLTRESLVRYAGASGDFNPIHYRDDVAERVGLPGVLAHGMLTMGLAVATIGEWLGDTGRIEEYGVRFTRPVVVDAEAGADVTVTAKVGAVDEAGARIDLTVAHGDTTVLGKAQVRVSLAAPGSHPGPATPPAG